MSKHENAEVVIVGGGVAGLSAALLLGRCLRRVVICDAGHPRNELSGAMHGFLGSDGIPPLRFLQLCREQLSPYETVSLWQGTTVTDIQKEGHVFEVKCDDGRLISTEAVLLATGLVDKLPEVEGAAECYAVTLHHCPYCDGWEHRGQMIGILGNDRYAVDLALELSQWSKHIALYTNSNVALEPEIVKELRGARITIHPGIVMALESRELGRIHQIRMAEGGVLHRCDALFFSPYQSQHSSLARKLGCKTDDERTIDCEEDGNTGMDGIFVAGNATKGVQMAIVAAAEGLKAAASVNAWLSEIKLRKQKEDGAL